MFDFLEMLQFGREIKCAGKSYLVMHSFQKGFYLAIASDAVMPFPAVVVKDDDYKEETDDGVS